MIDQLLYSKYENAREPQPIQSKTTRKTRSHPFVDRNIRCSRQVDNELGSPATRSRTATSALAAL